jgi:hypothetical protein
MTHTRAPPPVPPRAAGGYDREMDDDPITLDLRLTMPSHATLDALETALIRARATELSEVRRRQTRLITGYGDETSRGVMDDEGRRAQDRHDALDALLAAVRQAMKDATR